MNVKNLMMCAFCALNLTACDASDLNEAEADAQRMDERGELEDLADNGDKPFKHEGEPTFDKQVKAADKSIDPEDFRSDEACYDVQGILETMYREGCTLDAKYSNILEDGASCVAPQGEGRKAKCKNYSVTYEHEDGSSDTYFYRCCPSGCITVAHCHEDPNGFSACD